MHECKAAQQWVGAAADHRLHSKGEHVRADHGVHSKGLVRLQIVGCTAKESKSVQIKGCTAKDCCDCESAKECIRKGRNSMIREHGEVWAHGHELMQPIHARASHKAS